MVDRLSSDREIYRPIGARLCACACTQESARGTCRHCSCTCLDDVRNRIWRAYYTVVEVYMIFSTRARAEGPSSSRSSSSIYISLNLFNSCMHTLKLICV